MHIIVSEKADSAVSSQVSLFLHKNNDGLACTNFKTRVTISVHERF